MQTDSTVATDSDFETGTVPIPVRFPASNGRDPGDVNPAGINNSAG